MTRDVALVFLALVGIALVITIVMALPHLGVRYADRELLTVLAIMVTLVVTWVVLWRWL
jgi:hypothetical protein